MPSRYHILCEKADGSVVRVEAASDLGAAKQKLEALARAKTGYYQIFDRVVRRVVYVFSTRR